MKHEVITSREQWAALESEWDSLLERSRARSLFMTWAWLDTWVNLCDSTLSMLVVCVRNSAGRLVGAAPYYRTQYDLVKTIPYRVLRMLGDVDSGAEYQTWLVDQTDEDLVCKEIARALHSVQAAWDILWMPKLDAWTGANDPMIRALRTSGFGVNIRPSPFSSIQLPRSFDDYLVQMSANRRQQVRRMTKKILSKPGVEVREIENPEELNSSLESLFLLHNKRWASVGVPGVFMRSPSERRFYEAFVPIALERGWLAMYVLEDAGAPKAVQIGYVYDDVLLQLQEGFDPDYSAHVGNALRAWVLERLIEQGLREYDFLGGHSEHKRRWLATERDGMDLLVTSGRLKNLPVLKFRIWPTGRFLRLRSVN